MSIPNRQVDEILVTELRGALRNLYNSAVVVRSPLMFALDLHLRENPALALRRLLNAAIEALKPEDSVPHNTDAWRAYQVLRQRYVQRFTQGAVADDLGLSIRHLRRHEASAVRKLAQYICEHHGIDSGWQERIVPSTSEGTTTRVNELRTPSQEQEFKWLEVSVSSEPVGIKEAIKQALGIITPLLRASSVMADCNVADDLPRIVVQSVTLRQLLVSVLTAAARHIPGGRLHVEAQPLDGNLMIRISSLRRDAVPIPTTTDSSGSLDVARRLAKLLGGSLEVRLGQSDRQVFAATITLPAREQATILVIDDNPDTLQLVQRYLVGTGYRFVGTSDPEHAIALAAESTPSIILLDVMLPEMDGWELLGRIREHPITREVPVIICTILAEKDLALALGAAAFVPKPVSRKALLSSLDQQLALLSRGSR